MAALALGLGIGGVLVWYDVDKGLIGETWSRGFGGDVMVGWAD